MVAFYRKVILTLVIGFSFLTGFAQQIEVSGVVSDEMNQPLIGAFVKVKNSSNYVQTGLDGQYKISAKIGDTLVFSSIGYKSEERVVVNNTLNVTLHQESQTLDEVIMIYPPRNSASVQGMTNPRGFYDFRENTESYKGFKDNAFLSALKEPLSTFSLDVDVASYGNIRRMINLGQIPDKDAVRVEEMINYFSYDYPQPKGSHPVNIITESATCPWNKKHQIVRIGIKAREIPSSKLPASNFVFLIDVSGSMSYPNKLPLVISSMKLLVNNLRSSDRVAIVTYAGAAGEVLPSTSASDKQKIIEALDKLSAGGSTAGGMGIELAYKIAEKNFINGGNNRVILCTDGDFNVGISSNEGLESLIEKKRKSGIFLSVLGYGMGNYKDDKLQILAQKGNGNHAYVDNIQEANKVLVKEFGSTMYTVAKDVKLQVEFNPVFVNAYRLIGYETRLLENEDFNDDTKDAGELGAGHTVTALYEIVPVGVEAPIGKVDKLKYQEEKREAPRLTNRTELLTVKLRYKLPEEEVSKRIEIPVVAKSSSKSVSSDFNFAMAVAMFGQLLRDSDYKGTATYDDVINLAKKGIGNDPNGYRHEFIRLVEAVQQIQK